MPSGSATVLTWSRCSWTSEQVSCRVLTGAPESSNWPPGSRVTLARPRCSAIGRPCLLQRLPAEALGQALEQRPHAALALVGQRPQVVVGVAELLVLGADPPVALRLAAGLEILDQLAAVGDRLALGLRRRGHGRLPWTTRQQVARGRRAVAAGKWRRVQRLSSLAGPAAAASVDAGTAGSALWRSEREPGGGRAVARHRIAAIGGDGIGQEVIAAGLEVLAALGAREPGLAARGRELRLGLGALPRAPAG